MTSNQKQIMRALGLQITGILQQSPKFDDSQVEQARIGIDAGYNQFMSSLQVDRQQLRGLPVHTNVAAAHDTKLSSETLRQLTDIYYVIDKPEAYLPQSVFGELGTIVPDVLSTFITTGTELDVPVPSDAQELVHSAGRSTGRHGTTGDTGTTRDWR